MQSGHESGARNGEAGSGSCPPPESTTRIIGTERSGIANLGEADPFIGRTRAVAFAKCARVLGALDPSNLQRPHHALVLMHQVVAVHCHGAGESVRL